MDKDALSGLSLRPHILRTASSSRLWRPSLSRNNSHLSPSSPSRLSQENSPDDMRRSPVISSPQVNEAFGTCWDVEVHGASPRKMSADSTLSTSSSCRVQPLNINKPLPPRPGSRLSHPRPPTPDLCVSYESDESTKSESPPWTPPVVQPSRSGNNSKAGSQRSSISSFDLGSGPRVEPPPKSTPRKQPSFNTLLQNEYYTHELLCHLTPEGSPTFDTFRDLRILYPDEKLELLDLGCGRGVWAAEVALLWDDVHVTACDIEDFEMQAREWMPAEVAARITWTRADFIMDYLPFKCEAFHFIRLLAPSGAMPIDCWPRLLAELERVLKPGGRLELIDDEVIFPHITLPPNSSIHKNTDEGHSPFRKASVCSLPAEPEHSWEELEESGASQRVSPPTTPVRPTIARSPTSPNFKSEKSEALRRPSLKRSPTSFSGGRKFSRNQVVPEILEGPVYGHDPPSHRTSPPTLAERLKNAEDMEGIFAGMLKAKGVYRRSYEFLPSMLKNTFGEYRASRTHEFEILLPTSASIFETSRPHAPSVNSLDLSVDPFTLPPKARRMIDPLDEFSGRRSKAYQPPGFIVRPNNVFVPCAPDALEFHACKNMHLLLSSKPALFAFIQEQYGKHGVDTISLDEFESLLCLYDECKRTRLGWPNPSFMDDIDLLSQPTSPTKLLFNSHSAIFTRRRVPSGVQPVMHVLRRPPARHEVSPIRVVRVYNATKPSKCHRPSLIPLPSHNVSSPIRGI